jgi:hypothetical protein
VFLDELLLIAVKGVAKNKEVLGDVKATTEEK